MSQSILHYVDVSVALEGTGPQPAGFGIPMFLYQHALESPRLAGPFTSVQDVIDAGHAAGSAPALWATALMAQQPRVREFYIGRRDAGDADDGAAFTAVLAEDPGAWYCVNSASRTDADILALAAAVEGASFPKIAIVQSNAASLPAGEGQAFSALFGGTPVDGTYRLIFTGFGLGAPVNVDVVRAGGNPATNALLGDAMRTALTTAGGGSLSGEIITSSIGGTGATVTFRMAGDIPTGTVTVTDPESPDGLVVTTTDDAVGQRLHNAAYMRTALLYYSDDADYVDGAWTSRCLSFDLDTQKGVWGYKRLNGQTGDQLTNAQVTNLRDANVNYYAEAVMSSGVAVSAFTAPGWMAGGDDGAGRRIDITISLDWAKARLEEFLTDVLLRETHGIALDDAGINKFVAAANRHFGKGLAAGHYLDFVVPEGEDNEGTRTPTLVSVPKVSEMTSAERASGSITLTGLAYLKPYAEKVTFALEVRQ